MSAPKARYQIVVEVEAGDSGIRRLRAALKALLRVWRVRCVDLREVTSAE